MSAVTVERGQPAVPPIESVTIKVSPKLAETIAFMMGNSFVPAEVTAENGRVYNQLLEALELKPMLPEDDSWFDAREENRR